MFVVGLLMTMFITVPLLGVAYLVNKNRIR